MAKIVEKKLKALDILKTYSGNNPYILSLKRDVYVNGMSEVINDFNIDFIIENENFKPRAINKIIKMADWYGEQKQIDWKTDFIPNKIFVKGIAGETKYYYYCYYKYRKSMDFQFGFLSKKGLLTNMFAEDYHKIYVDFDRYDMLSMSKDPNRKLKNHQKDAVKFLLSRKKCVLADDMGLGKTNELIVASIEGNFDSVLIICPASVKTTWKKELMWYVPERDITIIDSFQGKNKNELEKMLGYGEGKSGKKVSELQDEAKEHGKWNDNRFVIVNFDILDEFYKIPKGRRKDAIDEAFNNSPMLKYIANKKSLIIIDEAHRLSNSTSIRYKTINDLVKRGKPDSIYAATGTPITNNPKNFYCVLKFLNDPITDDYNYYMERYCNAFKVPMKGEKQKWTDIFYLRNKYNGSIQQKDELKEFIRKNARMINVTNGASNLEELKERVSHIYLRRVKEDLNEVVKKTIHEVYYDLTDEQKSEYTRLWDEYEESKMDVNPESELNKELLETGLYKRYLSVEMVPNTIKLVDSILAKGEKVVIATCYDDELMKLKDYFGDKCVVYNGKMSIKKKDEVVNRFMTDDSCMVFIGQIIAAGVGLTLISSRTLVFNSFDYVYANNSQFQDRIHRVNQTRDCDIYYQIFRDTEFENIYNLVLRKKLISDSVIKTENEK